MADSRPPPQQLTSLVVPVYNEAENIIPLLSQLRSTLASEHETLLVYDFPEDTTLAPARDYAAQYPQMRLIQNTIGPGVLNALKTGLKKSKGEAVVVTMADMSDDVSQIEEMARSIHDGADVVAASRYMKGGGQVGGPPIKRLLSRVAGLSLRWLTRIGTHDATNNFKAYSRRLLEGVVVESGSGFELGLELTTKAHLGGYRIEEIPTVWRDRTAGESRFQVIKWLPGYLRWYFRCIGRSWMGEPGRARRERPNSLR